MGKALILKLNYGNSVTSPKSLSAISGGNLDDRRRDGQLKVDPSTDGQKTAFAGVRTAATRRHSDLLPWSYRLTPDDLTRLEELLKRSFPKVLWTCRLKDGSTITTTELGDILSLSNRGDERIKSVGVTASGDLFSERVSVDFETYGGISVLTNHNPDSSRLIYKDIKDICFNARPNYTLISDMNKVAKFLFWIGFSVLGGIFTVNWSLNTEVFAIKPTYKLLAWGLFFQQIPGFFIFFGDKVFPRASYVFGAGKRRDASAAWWRNVVLVTLFASILGGLVSILL